MDNTDMVLLDDFCASYHLEISFIHSLRENGLIETVAMDQLLYVTSNELPKLERITRLHQDLNINAEGIDAITHLLRHIDEMRQEINHLRNRLSFYEDEKP